MRKISGGIIALSAAGGAALAGPEIAKPVTQVLPDGKAGIGFDDLGFSPAHCVAADDAGHAFVCAPRPGAVLVVNDPFPASR
jgi:hypothetical protein